MSLLAAMFIRFAGFAFLGFKAMGAPIGNQTKRSQFDLILMISLMARLRREAARTWYRLSLTSSSNARRTASAVRSGS
jgi:hypothetical protein